PLPYPRALGLRPGLNCSQSVPLVDRKNVPLELIATMMPPPAATRESALLDGTTRSVQFSPLVETRMMPLSWESPPTATKRPSAEVIALNVSFGNGGRISH